MKKDLLIRALMLGVGFWITALGASFFIGSNLGSDGFTLAAQGLSIKSGLSVGLTSSIFSFTMMVAVFFIDKSYLKIGTLISLVVLGPSIDFWTRMCAPIHTFLNQMLLLQLLCVAIAIVIVALGISIVMSAKLGTHINDAIPILLSNTILKRWQFRVSKIACDVTQLLLGICLGGVFGIGTILSALCLGPVLQAIIPITESFMTTYIFEKTA